MKKLIALLLALVMVMGLVACGGNADPGKETQGKPDSTGEATGEATNPPAEEKGTIAVIAKGETHAFWQAVKAGAVDAGTAAVYNVTFRGPTAESEEYVNEQREMVQAALNTEDIKGIVLATIGLGFGEPLNFGDATADIYKTLPATFMVTLGGFLTNATYCLYQNYRNKSFNHRRTYCRRVY